MTHHHNAALSYLSSRPLTPTADLALRVAVVLVKWQHNWRTRRHLKDMDGHMLKDIGLTPEQARKEAQRPFWDCPAHWHVDRRR